MKPFLTNKGENGGKITLTESERILSVDIDVPEILNLFFSDATTSLDINENRYIPNNTSGIADSIDIALKSLNYTPVFLR